MTVDPALALHRFGLGPRPGDRAAIGGDPQSALAAELERPGIALLEDESLPDTPAALAAIRESNAARKEAVHMQAPSAEAPPDADTSSSSMADERPKAMLPRPAQQLIYQAEVAARMKRVLSVDIG